MYGFEKMNGRKCAKYDIIAAFESGELIQVNFKLYCVCV